MSTAARKARKRAGIPFTKAAKIPTPELQRSHTWRRRWNPTKMRSEFHPSRIALAHSYGIRDLGWQPATKYRTRGGRLTRAARA